MRPSTLIAFEGQSFLQSPTDGTSAPFQLVGLRSKLTPIHVAALPGTSIATRSPTVGLRLDQRIGTFARNVVIFSNGQQEIINGPMDAEDIVAAEEAYASARRSAGWDVVIASTMPSIGGVNGVGEPSGYGLSSAQEAVRLAYNEIIRESPHFDAVVDIAAIPGFADAKNSDLYLPDLIHPNVDGAAAYAEAMNDVLDELGV